MKYVKQLDSLRAIAVLMVIVSHWTRPNTIVTPNRLGMIGLFGVDLFFVLSGFLITSILLDGKVVVAKGIPIGIVMKNFYARRALRIFPIFYLTIFILAVAKFFIPEVNLTQLVFGATYTINIYFHRMQIWGEYTGHFWSLAVEEQFYLLWPLLMLLVNKKYIPHTITAFIIVGASSRLFETGEFGFLITYTCFDAFGLGALLAWILIHRPSRSGVFFRYVSVAAIISVIILTYELYLDGNVLFLNRLVQSLIAVWLVAYIMIKRLKNEKEVFRMLDSRYLIFIGKISYGIYIYHLYVPHIRKYLFLRFFEIQPTSPTSSLNTVMFFLLDLIVVIVVARLSWLLIEQPVLKYKKYFVNRKEVNESLKSVVGRST